MLFKRFIIDADGAPKELAQNDEDPTLVPDLERAYGIELPNANAADGIHWLRELIDIAQEESRTGSQRKFAELLGVSPSTITYWRNGKTIPGETMMIRLAEIAGEDPDEAIMLHDLLISKSPDARNTRLTILRLIWSVKNQAETAIPSLLLGFFTIEQLLNKGTQITQTLYIM